MRAVEDGKRVPVEHGKIVLRILDTGQRICYYNEVGSGKEQKHRIRARSAPKGGEERGVLY